MPARFRIEHVSTTPADYKVRTVVRDGHRVRIAFPRGRRGVGSGRVVQIIHPRSENPPCRLPNPAELVVMMANPSSEVRKAFIGKPSFGHTTWSANIPRSDGTWDIRIFRSEAEAKQAIRDVRKGNPSEPRVETYRLMSGGNRPIRMATKVVFPDGREVKFIDRIPKGKAIREAKQQLGIRNPSQGQAASNLYEQFHGGPGRHIDEYHEPSPRPATLAELGDLVELRVKTDVGWKLRSLDFTGNGIKVASNATGTQIYFVGGNQRIGALALFGADRSKELLDLGECCYIAYRAKKAQVNRIASNYDHVLGEETGRCPRLMYDRRGREPRLYFTGGEYHVAGEGIVN